MDIGTKKETGAAGRDRLIRFFYFLFLICYAAVTASAILRGADKLLLVLTGLGIPVCMACLCWIDRLLSRREAALEHLYPRLLLLFSIAMFCLEMFLALVLRHDTWYDVGAIHQGAIEWLETGTFTRQYWYYDLFPNNLGSMTFLYLCFKAASLLGYTDYYVVGCLVTCAMLTGAMALVSLICRRLAGTRSAVLALTVFALSLQFWVMGAAVYTDTLSMLFPILIFYLYLLSREKTGRTRFLLYLGMGLAAGIGSVNKITVLIMVIAVLIDVALRREYGALLKIGVCTLGIALAMNMALNDYMYANHLSRETAEAKNTPILHWVMMGLSKEGKFSEADYDITREVIPQDHRNQALLEEIKRRIAEKGPLGMINLFSTKSAFDFGDGTYGIDDFLSIYPAHETWLHQFVLRKGEHYSVYKGYVTALHLALMLFMLAGARRLVSRKCPAEARLQPLALYVALFGLWVFLMWWETNCRYFSNFAPVLITCGILGVEPLRLAAGEKLRKRRAAKG